MSVAAGFSISWSSISTAVNMPPKVAVPFAMSAVGGVLVLFACAAEGKVALVLLAVAIALAVGSLIAALVMERRAAKVRQTSRIPPHSAGAPIHNAAS
jgi:mannitol-specific phosphotransferase system IIBC component